MFAPIWNFEERENLRRYLNQEPRQHRVGDCDFVDIAPFQLSEEVLRVHSARLERSARHLQHSIAMRVT